MLSYCYVPYLYLNHLVEGGKGNKDDKAEEALFMMDTVAPTEEDTFVETIGETGTEAPKGGKNNKDDKEVNDPVQAEEAATAPAAAPMEQPQEGGKQKDTVQEDVAAADAPGMYWLTV